MRERTRTTYGNRHSSSGSGLAPAGARPGTFGLLLLAAGLTLSTFGCGNLTAGGARGEATVAVSGDAPEESSQSSVVAPELATVSGSATDPSLQVSGPIGVGGPVEGQVKATLRVFLEGADGERIALLDENEQAEVDIQGASEVTLGRSELDVGVYPRIRVVFTDIEADVRSGLEIAGQVLKGRITVGGEDLDSLAVEIDRQVEIREDDVAELLIDLNSTAWLNAANPALKTVATAKFREAVNVQVR